MTLRPWWNRWPGRLEAEQKALDEAGIPWELDKRAFEHGLIQLRLYPELSGQRLELIADFPDFYPYTRFQVYAPSLNLPRHQHPFSKNLCLIGRSTRNWSPRDMLASFIKERLPPMLEAAESDNLELVASLEEHQGEPFSDYYSYQENSIILIDSSWPLDPSIKRGELVIGVHQQAGFPLRGAVLEIFSNDKNHLASAPALKQLYPKCLDGRWIRISEPIRETDPRKFLTALGKIDKGKPKWVRLNGRRVEIIGVVFPEEVRWNETKDGWVFLVHIQGKKGKPGEIQLVRAGRAGPIDIAQRIPELNALQNKCAAVIGLGGLGGPSALELAKSGIGELRIIDHDIVEPGTAVRWPFGFALSGLSKAEILMHIIGENWPYTKVVGRRHRVGDVRPPIEDRSELEILDEFLDSVDLIFDATAELGIHHLLADIAAERELPYLYLWSTPGAWGGLVARIRPQKTEGCWLCLQYALQDGTIPEPPHDPSGNLQPLGCADPTFTGAGFDIAVAALAGVRLAISTLCRGIAGAYPDTEWDVAVLSLRDEKGKIIPPRWQTFPLERHPRCSCNRI